MNCPEVQELFSDYLDARMAPSQAALLKEHLGACAACRQELAVLRSTVALIGSLDEIKTSPDFLAQVNRKIDTGSVMSRLWRWIFTPAKIKLPIEAAALAVISILAVYLYRPSEPSHRGVTLSQKSPVTSEAERQRAERDPDTRTQDRSTVLAYKELRRKEEPSSFFEAFSKKEIPPPPAVQAQRPPQPQSAEPVDPAGPMAKSEESGGASGTSSGREARLASPAAASAVVERMPTASAPQVVEVQSEDVGRFQRRVRDMLANLTGRVVSERASEEGLLLAVEVPQSREEEFRSALKKEAGTGLSRMAAKKGQSAKAAEEQRARSPVPAAQRAMRSEEKLSAAKEEPTVAIEIRVWAKK
jgi:hypothetical protein